MTVWTFNSIWTSTILHILWNINGLLNKGKWVMTMFREALIWIVLLIFNLINTFLVFVGKTSLFKVPLWSTWLVWGIVTIIIIGVLLLENIYKKQPLINKSLNNKDFKAGEFFVQMPLYIIENQSNVIYGNETITYKPVLLIDFINY